MSDNLSVYESAHVLISAHNSADQALEHIIGKVMDYKVTGNKEEMLTWLDIGCAVKELADLSKGELTIH